MSINIPSVTTVSDMFMSHEDCPVSCKIDALKLRAANFYICENNLTLCAEWFLKAVELEETLKDPLPVQDKSLNLYSYDEVHTVQQFNQMYIHERSRPGTIMMQCLVVVERCLGGKDGNMIHLSNILETAIHTLINSDKHKQCLLVCSRWQELIEHHLVIPTHAKPLVDGTYISLWFKVIAQHVIEIYNGGNVTPDLENAMTFGKKCFAYLYDKGIEEEASSSWICYSLDLLYNAVLKILSVRVEQNIHSSKKCKSLCDEVVDLFCRRPHYLNFMQQFFVHFRLTNELNIQILENFLSSDKVYKHINTMVYNKTIISAFSIVDAQLQNIYKYDRETVKKIVDLFIDNGAHIDCVDRNGHCLVDWENRSTVVYECLKHRLPLSLMCLSARAVIHQKINYDILPCHCKQFVSLHDSNNC